MSLRDYLAHSLYVREESLAQGLLVIENGHKNPGLLLPGPCLRSAPRLQH